MQKIRNKKIDYRSLNLKGLNLNKEIELFKKHVVTATLNGHQK